MSFEDTLIGDIPSEWSIYTVGELYKQNVIEKPLDGNHGGIHPKGEDFVQSGIPFIMASDIKDGRLSFENCKYITERQAKSLKKGFSKNDDVLLTHKATIGRVALVNNVPDDMIVLTPQVTYYRIKDENKLINKYLKYYFENGKFQKIMHLWSGAGSTRSYLGITQQLKLPIVVPPIKEQLFISNILASLDNKIELNNAINKNLEEMAQALFKRWFVDFEFPNENGEPYKSSGGEFEESELGLIPKEWKIAPLSEITNVLMGQSPKSEFYNTCGEGMPFHQGVSNYGSRFPTHNTFCTQALRVATKGSILISVRAPVGRLNIADEDIIIGRGLGAINSKEKCNSFVYYLLKRIFAIEDQHGSGTIFNSITKKELENIKVIVPNSSIVREFESIASKIDEQIFNIAKQNISLINTRDTLLPKLMSGEIRVPLDQA